MDELRVPMRGRRREGGTTNQIEGELFRQPILKVLTSKNLRSAVCLTQYSLVNNKILRV